MKHDFSTIHILRWEELPDFSLYVDQVIDLVEQSLSFLSDIDTKLITSTMINNYVKSRIVPAPVKKRYTKNHVACFTVICLLKKVYSLEEIAKLLQLQFDTSNIENAYNIFCEYMETKLNGSDPHPAYSVNEETVDIFEKALDSVVYKIIVQTDLLDVKPIVETIKEHEAQEKKNKKARKESA